jgi:hypothetical protein
MIYKLIEKIMPQKKCYTILLCKGILKIILKRQSWSYFRMVA